MFLLVLLNQHEDVVHVDLNLFDQLDLKHHIVVDDFLLALFAFAVGPMQVQIPALILLNLSRAQRRLPGKLVESREDVLQPQDRSPQSDELLLRALPHDRLPIWELLQQLASLLHVRAVVVLIRLQQHDPAGVLVPKQLQRCVGFVLQVPEGHDVPVALHGIEDSVCPRVRLNEPMGPKVLVHEQGVERCSIEPGQEHVHHDHQINLAVLHPLGEVLVVVLETLRTRIVACPEHAVVVLNRILKEAPRVSRKRRSIERFLPQCGIFGIIVGPIRVDQPNLELLARCRIQLLHRELVVVPARCIDRGRGKQRVEPVDSLRDLNLLYLALVPPVLHHLCNVYNHVVVIATASVPLRLVIEMLTNVGHHRTDPPGIQHHALVIRTGDLLLINIAPDLDRVDVIDAERQHVLVRDGIHDRVCVQLFAKRLFGGLHPGLAARTGIHGEDRRTREPEEVVPLERLRNRGMHVTELGPVALIEYDHNVLRIHRMLGIPLDEVRELLDRGNNDFRVRVFELTLQFCGGRVGIRGSFLKPVVFAHRLVVQIFSVDDEQHLFHIRQLCS